jgi:hypothetical protein
MSTGLIPSFSSRDALYWRITGDEPLDWLGFWDKKLESFEAIVDLIKSEGTERLRSMSKRTQNYKVIFEGKITIVFVVAVFRVKK